MTHGTDTSDGALTAPPAQRLNSAHLVNIADKGSVRLSPLAIHFVRITLVCQTMQASVLVA